MAYPSDVKESIMKLLYEPNAPTIRCIARDFGVSRSTISHWMRQAGMMTPKEVNEADKDKYWHPEVKLDAVIKSMTLSEDDFGEYLRKNGLYSSLITQWKEKILDSLVNTNKYTRPEKTNVRSTTQYQNLKKELDRKDKALAEITALLVLKKKADLIWGEEEEKPHKKTEEKL